MSVTGLFKSFRIRIVVFTTAGVVLLVVAWLLGGYQNIRATFIHEVEVELKILTYLDSSLMRGISRGGPDRPAQDAFEKAPDSLLLSLGRNGEVAYKSPILDDADMPLIMARLDELPAPIMPDFMADRRFRSIRKLMEGEVLTPEERQELEEDERFTKVLSGEKLSLEELREVLGDSRRGRPKGGEPSMDGMRGSRGFDRMPVDAFRIRIGDDDWLCQPVEAFGHKSLYGVSLSSAYDRSNMVLARMLMLIPALVIVTLVITWLVANHSLRPIHRMSDLAEKIDVDSLDQRLSTEEAPSEFRRLLDVFNEMLERLENSFKQSKRFSADASHELKTPLTILQGKLEQEIETEEPGSQRQRRIASLLDEVMRLRQITDKLLLLTYGDSGQLRLAVEEVDVLEIINGIIEDFDQEDHYFEIEKSPESTLKVNGDPDMLRKVFQNLYENALKFNRPGGKVLTRIRVESGLITVDIGNNGVSIPEEMQPHVFNRFFRAAASRNRKVNGTGLGLSLVKEIVRLHRGSVELLESREDWTEFRICLSVA